MQGFDFIEEYFDYSIKLSRTVPITVTFSAVVKNKKGFTLAEVLITLGVIGVIAALTIPTLVKNYQKQEYLTGLKKAYSEFNQALKQMASDNGCPGDLKCVTGFDAANGLNNPIGDELVKYFKVIKNCKTSAGQGCWPSKTIDDYDLTGGGNNFDSWWGGYKFITTDGMSVGIYNYGGPCDNNESRGVTGELKETCGEIVFDVNGLKGPNAFGIDTFYFLIANGKGPELYPMGGIDSRFGYWKDMKACSPQNPAGTYCAARIIEEGWQMNYYGTHSNLPANPYSSGIMPNSEVLVALGNAINNNVPILKEAMAIKRAADYAQDLGYRQITI